jgi:hypothetical protein
MGWKQNQPFQFSFNACLKVDFRGSRVTSDSAPLLALARGRASDALAARGGPGKD